MPQLIAEKTVRARKPHKCRACHQTAIQPGEEYKRSTYVFDGRVYDWVMCAGCNGCESYVFNWCSYIDDGIGAAEYEEWAFDTGQEADSDPADQTPEQQAAVAYLKRRGLIVDHLWIGVAGHPDDPECTHRSDGTDATYCGRVENRHLWSTR